MLVIGPLADVRLVDGGVVQGLAGSIAAHVHVVVVSVQDTVVLTGTTQAARLLHLASKTRIITRHK